MNKMDWFVIIGALLMTAMLFVIQIVMFRDIKKRHPEEKGWGYVIAFFGALDLLMVYFNVRLIIDIVTH